MSLPVDFISADLIRHYQILIFSPSHLCRHIVFFFYIQPKCVLYNFLKKNNKNRNLQYNWVHFVQSVVFRNVPCARWRYTLPSLRLPSRIAGDGAASGQAVRGLHSFLCVHIFILEYSFGYTEKGAQPAYASEKERGHGGRDVLECHGNRRVTHVEII